MKILILDDHYADIAEYLNEVLEGDEIVYAATPLQARRALEVQNFDVLLLDGNLGNAQTGPEVLRGWKAQGLKLPPAVMFSADDELQKKGMEEGAVSAISKKPPWSDSDFTGLRRFGAG